MPNPSHLELIDPIQQGIIRCKQEMLGNTGRTSVVPLCMHGDAAFTGQGIVQETLNLSELPGSRTGGTIHLIINNQIGFTTPPQQGRFTPYPTDIAKTDSGTDFSCERRRSGSVRVGGETGDRVSPAVQAGRPDRFLVLPSPRT